MERELSVRRVAVRLTIGSFSLAALMGVAALLRPGRFGDTEGRILLTTLVVGVVSVLTLCYLAPTGGRSRLVGAAGETAALVAAACALVFTWPLWQQDPGRGLLRTFGVAAVAALTLAQFSLLLAVVRRRAAVERLITATVVAGTVLAGLVIATILGWDASDAGARAIGVVAILDVLGTVVTMALGIFGRDAPRRDDGPLQVTLSPETAALLLARSRATGRPVADLVGEAVAAYRGSSVE
jgi:membrane associated rhomboid family serine protease